MRNNTDGREVAASAAIWDEDDGPLRRHRCFAVSRLMLKLLSLVASIAALVGTAPPAPTH
jgi:hypothetical protein